MSNHSDRTKNNFKGEQSVIKTSLKKTSSEICTDIVKELLKIAKQRGVKADLEKAEELIKASKKQLEQMIGPDSGAPHHQEAIKKIKKLFPNSTHDVWFTKHYRNNPKILEEHGTTLQHLSDQMKIHNDLRLHDVSKMSFEDGMKSLLDKEGELSKKTSDELSSHLYRPASDVTEHMPIDNQTSWFNLNRGGCPVLGKKHGTCGNGDGQPGDNLFYLAERVNHEGKEHHRPSNIFISNDGYIGEMKGRLNKKPDPKTHEAIMKFLMHPDVKGIIGGGWLPHENFDLNDLSPEQKQKVLEAKPHLDVLNTEEELNHNLFPERFRDDIRDHNGAIGTCRTLGNNPDEIIKAFKEGRISQGTLSDIVKHPKKYKLFNKDHLERLLNLLMSSPENDSE